MDKKEVDFVDILVCFLVFVDLSCFCVFFVFYIDLFFLEGKVKFFIDSKKRKERIVFMKY